MTDTPAEPTPEQVRALVEACPQAEHFADYVAVCPVCQRPVPTFEPGEVGPFCTPITCSAWKVTATFNHETRQWEVTAQSDGHD